MHRGLYADMKAIRKDEIVDDIHSFYVEQWDWEKVIDKSDRNLEYLKDTVRAIYKAIRQTAIYVKGKYQYLSYDLPKSVYFITSQELENLYPDKTPKEREQIIGEDKKAVFIIGIGDKLKSGKVHDMRSPDYDDWQLNGDLLIYDKSISKTIEISSMGIRVDKKSLIYQLKVKNEEYKLKYKYHQDIINDKLPLTIGGGIGQSRMCLFMLNKVHIGEVQASFWSLKDIEEFAKLNIKLL